MSAALIIPILLAAPQKLWSEEHGVGMRIPSTWEQAKTSKKGEVFVINGPKLGGVRPRAVLRDLGESPSTLTDLVGRLSKELLKRPSWTLASITRKSIGPAPCRRLGFFFEVEGDKGRGRVTIVRLGRKVFVLELSAARSHFPATTFDQLEQSLARKAQKIEGPAGLMFEAPPGWEVEARGVVRLTGPIIERGPAVMILSHQSVEVLGGIKGKEGPQVLFLEKKRPTVLAEEKIEKFVIRMLHLEADGYEVRIMMPAAAWDDLFPIAAGILKSARLPKEKGK